MFAQNVNRFADEYPDMPNVAAICVYPSLIESVRETLRVKDVKIAAVEQDSPHHRPFPGSRSGMCALYGEGSR